MLTQIVGGDPRPQDFSPMLIKIVGGDPRPQDASPMTEGVRWPRLANEGVCWPPLANEGVAIEIPFISFIKMSGRRGRGTILKVISIDFISISC